MTAFAVLCHGEPERLSFLLEALDGFDVYIHIDRFSNRKAILSSIQNNDLSKVIVISEKESIRGSWGGFSIVEIQLKLIAEFLNRSLSGGPLVFLSGQDYQIKSLQEFAKYLETKENFISIQLLDIDKINSGDPTELSRLNRFRKLHIQDFRFFHKCKDRQTFRYKFGSLPSAIVRRMKIPNPYFKLDSNYFIGSQWIAINESVCDMLLRNSKALKSEFRFTFCPDELAFQSLYGRMQIDLGQFRSKVKPAFDSVIDADFHFIHHSLNHFWELSELNLIINSGKFFVRKPSLELLSKLRQLRLED